MSPGARALTIALLAMTAVHAAQVETGLDVLVADQLGRLRGKAVAIVCNQTSITRTGEHIVDRLAREEGITIRALFAPEHGIRGVAEAGAEVGDTVEAERGIPIFSLYDASKAPTREELAGVDVILYDLQDIGARFYTKISTLGYVLESAGECGVPVIVLERPNVVSGLAVEGPVCEPSQFSFVGRYPIPIRHGLTGGELALMMVAERWIAHADEVDLTVIPCRGWTRAMYFDETGLPFVPPSPNIPDLETAIVYPATCPFEGTNVSEGRGTEAPFRTIGAPFVDAARWAAALASEELPGVRFEAITFTPRPNAGDSHPKHEGHACQGVRITVTDRAAFRPVRTGLSMLCTLAALWPAEFAIGERAGHFDHLWGTSAVREALTIIQTRGAVDSDGALRSLLDRMDLEARAFAERSRRHWLHE